MVLCNQVGRHLVGYSAPSVRGRGDYPVTCWRPIQSESRRRTGCVNRIRFRSAGLINAWL